MDKMQFYKCHECGATDDCSDVEVNPDNEAFCNNCDGMYTLEEQVVGVSESKVVSINTLNAVKDLAIRTVAIASGVEDEDVFIDLETVGDRFPQEEDYPSDEKIETIKELRACVEEAHKREADYLHLF